jgi:polyhydroxybutyrate depolymerase
MKRNLCITIVSSMFFFSVISFAQYDTLNYDDIDRTYLLHVPSSYNGLAAVPLVVALHPFGSNGSGFESTTGFSVKADSNNFIVVYPNGSGSPVSWNGGNCCGSAMTNDIDDVGFISALIDTLSANYNIDSSRIFATGFSNGSIMAYRLAAELSDKIAAIAAASGQMMLDECEPIRAVPIMHLHALDDGAVPYEGGSASGYVFPSVESVIDIWVEINNCETEPDTIVNSGALMVKRWAALSSNADIVLYTTPSGGHSWLTSIPAADSIWNFFDTHPMDPSTGIDDGDPDAVEDFILKQNYPNPFSATTTIRFSTPEPEKVVLKVFDLLGKEVAVLLDEEVRAGEHAVTFSSEKLPNGVYFFRIEAGTFVDAKKLVLLR